MIQKPDFVSLDVLSNGNTHMRPTVIIRTTFDIYVFNCPEGTVRFLQSLRVSPQMLKNFFITRDKLECFGGFFAILLAKEGSDDKNLLHGPSKMERVLKCVRPFTFDESSTVQRKAFQMIHHVNQSEKYEDGALVVHSLPMFVKSSDPTTDSCDVAYLVELKEPNRRIDILKCKEKNVPNGPMIGKLKSGKSVTLADGTVVVPEEVYGEESKDCCPNVLIVDCDNIEKLESLVTNDYLQEYVNGQTQMGYVVHYTPELVSNDERYQNWMESFGPDCLNLMVNGSGEASPITEGVYKQQRMLNEVCPDLFPNIYPDNSTENKTQDVKVPSTNIVKVKSLTKYPMRTTRLATGNDDAQISLDESELEMRVNEDPSISTTIAKFKEKVATLDLSDSEYPSVSFLGTGSAVPSKFRNVTAHLLRLNSGVSVLVDSGEGTYGQLKVLYGPEKVDDILLGLSAIFITHSHLDHMVGTMTVVEQRREAFKRNGLAYRQLILVCNRLVRTMLENYNNHFHEFDPYVKFVEIGILVQNPGDFTGYSTTDLISDVTKMLPSDLYSPELWNLKAIKAVQVHHTQISNGFVFDTECGKRIVFSGDTMPCELLVRWGKNADLLIHEATFEDGYENDACRKAHSTSGQAIDITHQMKAKFLVLSHFSARYPRIPYISNLMLRSNVGVAFDNMVVSFNRRQLLPMLLPVYCKLFEKEMEELSLKEMQKSLRVASDD